MRDGFETNEAGSTVWAGTPIVQQLAAAGVMPYLTPIASTEKVVLARARLDLIPFLERHKSFASGGLHKLHADIGDHLRDFRSFNGTLGKGSLQIVVDEKTGNFYADIDHFNPYQDAVNWTGHAGEVIGGFIRKLRRRKAQP